MRADKENKYELKWLLDRQKFQLHIKEFRLKP